MNHQHYKRLLFDADRTLLDFDKSESVAFNQVCNEFQIEGIDSLFEDYHKINKRLWDMHELGKIKRERLIYQRFEELFQEKEISVDPIRMEDRYQYLLSEKGYLLPEALQVVKQLSHGYELYIVTNGVKETQMKRIISTGLQQYFKEIFISGEIGYQKPSIEFFENVFNRIPQFTREETIIIGDSLTSDIRGGNIAGIDTCWYNPHHSYNTTEAVVDIEVHELSDLIQIFKL